MSLDQYLAPPTPVTPGDPFEEELRRRQRDQAVFQSVRGGNPNQAGRANELARQFGVPAETVERNLPQFEAADRGRVVAEMAQRYPAIGHWTAQPRNAAVGQDDVSNLARISRAFHEYGQGREAAAEQRAADYRRRFGDLVAPPAPAPTVGNFFRGVWTSLTEGGEGLKAVGNQIFTDLGIHAPGQDPSIGADRSLVRVARAQARVDQATPGFKSATMRGLYAGVSSFAQMAPALALSVAAGDPAPALAFGGATQGLGAYGKYRVRGASPGMAAVGGTAEGAVEVATELIPMKYMTGAFGKVGFGEFVAGLMGREIPTEQIATFAQDAVDTAIANPNKTWNQFLQERPSAAYQTLVATVAQTMMVGGPSHIANRLNRQADAATAQTEAGFVDDLMTAAADSKVRPRDPQAFQSYIAEHSQGSPVENIYIPGEKLREMYQSADFDDGGFFASRAGEIEEAAGIHGDVVVPLAEAAAHLAGTKAWESIKDDVRLSPGGMSLNEARTFDEAKADEMKAMGESIAAETEAERQAAEPRQKIVESVRDKLMHAGFRPDVAMSYAELWTARYATRAARLGRELTGTEADGLEIGTGGKPLEGAAFEQLSRARLLGLAALVGISTPQQIGGAALPIAQTVASSADPVLEGVASAYPRLRQYTPQTIVKIGTANDGRQLEYYSPWERENPNPGKITVEIFNHDLKGRELSEAIALDMLHYLGGLAPDGHPIDPAFYAMKQEMKSAILAADRRMDTEAYEEERRAGLAGPSYEDWLDDNRVDAYIRGYVSPEMNPEWRQPGTFTPEMEQVGERIKQYLQTEPEARQLFQSFNEGPRGKITFTTDGKSIIDLFEARDLSTFIHESGHLFLEELKTDAESMVNPQVFADFEAVKAWFKREGHEIGADGTISTEAHELWARGFERFAMEGKAPSSALKRAFDAFRSWLLTIYKVVDNLKSPITPEIRDVMQRLIATDEEISAAAEEQNIKSLFTSAEKAAEFGMTAAAYEAHTKLAEEARGEAYDALIYRTMSAIRKRKTQAWKNEEAGVRGEVAEGIDRQPVFKALRLVTSGEEKIKLDREWLIATYGAEALNQLPRRVPPIYSNKATTDADTIAEMTGFASGDEMVRTLMGLEAQTKDLRAKGDKRSVRQVQIDELTAKTMLARGGDILNDGSIEDEARALIHNDRQGEVIASEIRALGRRANKRPTPYALAKEWAAGKIAQSQVVEATSGAALQRYERSARNASKAAEKAMLAGDIDETYRQKQAQMLNNALVSEANKAKEQVEAAAARLGKLAKRATIKSVEQGYLDQAHALLEQVEFRSRSQASLDRQESFAAWAEAQETAGFDVVVPPSFAASLGTTHWSRLTVEQLLGLDDTVKQIVHLGRLKQKLLDGIEERDFNEVVGEAVNSAAMLPPKPPSDLMEPSRWDSMKAGVASADAALLKMETIVDWLDSGKSEGVFNRIVFKPVADAQSRAADMFADYIGRLHEAMAAVPKEQLRRWSDRISVPELVNRDTGNPFTLTRQQLVSAALNMGNEGNAQRLADGYGWSEQNIMAALNRELSPEEWAYVQSVWDIIDGLWPHIEQVEKRVNGMAPEKVPARPLETSSGTLRGGYFPAVYDSTRDYRAESNVGKEGDLFEARYTRATTRSSATKDRANKVQRPILLNLGVITRHVGEVVHDITHREAVMNADKFITNPRVMKAVDTSLGPAMRKQFRPWLKSVANQWAMERAGNEGVGAFINKLRSNATVVGLGFRFSTMTMQLAGYSNSFEVVGAKWVTAAVAQTSQHPIEAFQFVTQKSGEIRHRMDTLDRDIESGIRRMAGKSNPITNAKRFAYHGIGYMDRVVVIPTWLGAYNKALAGGMEDQDAVYAADKAVRQSQGAGAAKDLAAVARGTGQWGQALKLMTMFYSYMSAVYQRQRTLGRDIRAAKAEDVPGLMARAWWLVVVPPLLSELMGGRGPDDDEDWGWWAFKQMLFQGLGAIPIVRDIAHPAWDALTGKKGFDYQLSPLQRAGQSVVDVAKDAGKLARGDDTKRATRDTLEAVGYWTGLVPGQVAASTQFLVDVAYGDQDPESVGDWYQGLTKGRVPVG